MSSVNTKDEEIQPLIAPAPAASAKKQQLLLITFLTLVVIGLGNKIFQKLQAIPMYNYPYFLNILTTFVYIPLSFAYIIPMMIWGTQITSEQRAIPLYKFAVMGCLDGIAGIMQTFSVNYIPSGSLIILLTQAAIPISMIISRVLLKTKYGLQHYVGAMIVVAGLVTVLVPKFVHPAHNDDQHHIKPVMMGVWCGVLMLSCVPMTLSSVYKEKALGEIDIDVVYMNGWIAIFQFMISIPLAIPSAYASDIKIQDIPKNIWDGARCYAGYDTILTGKNADDCHHASLFVTLYIAFNVGYNILIIMMLKYGSSNLLWLAMTFMVPLGNVAFSLHFVPQHQPLSPWDIVGLVVIMVGLVIYRFWEPLWNLFLRVSGRAKNRELEQPNDTQYHSNGKTQAPAHHGAVYGDLDD